MNQNTEQDRRAFYKDMAIDARREAVDKWLAENPDVGVLNGGKYYRIVNGEQVMVQELQPGANQ